MSHSLPRYKVRRHAERGHYDPSTIFAILDEAYMIHVSVIRDGIPVTIPTLHVRIGNKLYVHGAVAAGLFKDLAHEEPVCISATILDGLVLARSLYNHSANYRSVVAFAVPEEVRDAEQKMRVLEAMAERLCPGRWQDARQPNSVELRRTRIFALPLERASAKIRSGPPIDDPEDLDRPTWAGIIPLALVRRPPVADPNQPEERPLPDYLQEVMPLADV